MKKHTHTLTHTHTHTNTHTYIHTYIYMHVRIHIHTHARKYIRIHKYTYTHTYPHEHIPTYKNKHTHICILNNFPSQITDAYSASCTKDVHHSGAWGHNTFHTSASVSRSVNKGHSKLEFYDIMINLKLSKSIQNNYLF